MGGYEDYARGQALDIGEVSQALQSLAPLLVSAYSWLIGCYRMLSPLYAAGQGQGAALEQSN